ncbi:MAG: hypothetical protein ACI8VW_001805, partial [bacterium]
DHVELFRESQSWCHSAVESLNMIWFVKSR